jgi:hypothetical protein
VKIEDRIATLRKQQGGLAQKKSEGTAVLEQIDRALQQVHGAIQVCLQIQQEEEAEKAAARVPGEGDEPENRLSKVLAGPNGGKKKGED